MSIRMSEAQAKALLGSLYEPPKNQNKTKKTAVNSTAISSTGEDTLALHLRAEGVRFVTQFRFNPDRRWKSDFRIEGTKILVEVEGGTWSGGRHTRGKGYEKDCEKYSYAASHGWIVLRYTTAQVKSGMALSGVLTALKKAQEAN